MEVASRSARVYTGLVWFESVQSLSLPGSDRVSGAPFRFWGV